MSDPYGELDQALTHLKQELWDNRIEATIRTALQTSDGTVRSIFRQLWQEVLRKEIPE